MSVYKQLGNILLNAGLTEAEARVYEELLKNPVQTKWELTGRTGLNRNAVYRACEKLESLKMAGREGKCYKACSLKAFVAGLNSESLQLRRLSNKIKNIAPYLRIPNESVEEFETCYTQDQIRAVYLFMSEHRYDTNLEFGDYEGYVPVLGSLEPSIKFRNQRLKHATAHAICTTFGPNSAFFCTKNAKEVFKVTVDRLNIDFSGSFIQFSDNNDYVLFNNFSEKGNEHSVLIKSKAVADIQRAQFKCFSRLVEKTK